MATVATPIDTYSATERAEVWLSAVEATAQDLPTLQEEWEQLDKHQRASISQDWDHVVGTYLGGVIEFHHAHQLTPSQEARFKLLLCCLDELRPVIVSLDLVEPPFVDLK